MAHLFTKQAELYALARPRYPPNLFRFIASKSPNLDLAWDFATGNGQAASLLSEIYKNVIATDANNQQLSHATIIKNVQYILTPLSLSISEVMRDITGKGSVDVVTVAQALHWLDLPSFYELTKYVLRPHGVLAAWCYTIPLVNDTVDDVLIRLYTNSESYWAPARKHVEDEYRNLPFPFEPVEGTDHTGPFRFEATCTMDLNMYLAYIRSWSAYQSARDVGVELLDSEMIGEFERGWGGNSNEFKLVKFPIHLRIGKV